MVLLFFWMDFLVVNFSLFGNDRAFFGRSLLFGRSTATFFVHNTEWFESSGAVWEGSDSRAFGFSPTVISTCLQVISIDFPKKKFTWSLVDLIWFDVMTVHSLVEALIFVRVPSCTVLTSWRFPLLMSYALVKVMHWLELFLVEFFNCCPRLFNCCTRSFLNLFFINLLIWGFVQLVWTLSEIMLGMEEWHSNEVNRSTFR